MNYKDDPKLYHRNYYVIRRNKLLQYLGNKCSKCGSENDLEFDHIIKENKSFNIKNNLTLNENVKAELDKCQLLCKFCHLEKTSIENTGFKHGTLYSWMKKKCDCEICTIEKRLWYDKRNEKRRKK